MKIHPKTFKVTYTSRREIPKTILVKAHNAEEALNNAKDVCVTGRDFRDAQ